MKKIIAFLASFVLACSFTACGKKDSKAKDSSTSDNGSASVSDTQISENSNENDSSKEEVSSSSGESDKDLGNSTNQSEDSTVEKDTDDALLSQAKVLFEKGGKTESDIFINSVYQLAENGDEEGWYEITDPKIKTLQDVIDDYCSVFYKISDALDEKYREVNGKVYCRDGGRGGNIFYVSTDIEGPISKDEAAGIYTFNAVSHYADPDTGENPYDETHKFSIIKTNNGYRILEYTLPF